MGLISRVSSRTYRIQMLRIFSSRNLTVATNLITRSQASAIPAADGEAPQFAPHIVSLVDQIGKLTLLEVSQMNKLMKEKFNLSDASVAAPVAAAAAPVAGAVAAVAPAAAAAAEEEEAAPAAVQTEFNVKLVKFDAKAKIKVIKELKTSIDGLNLVQAKKMAESAPVDIKQQVSKDEAEELKKKFEALGCEIKVE